MVDFLDGFCKLVRRSVLLVVKVSTVNGGEIILKEIRNGSLGEKNANISVIVYTAHLDAPSFKIPHNAYNGIFSKTTGSVGIVNIIDDLFNDKK